MLTFGSLFTGVGGMDLGLVRAGLRPIWQVELREFERNVLSRHWPDVPKFHDVKKFCRRIHDCGPETEDGEVWCPRCTAEFGDCECMGTDQVIDEWGVPDLIVGGDPCQENSNARRNGTCTQPSLGAEFIRVVDELRPRLVLRENPPPRKDAVWGWERFRSELEQIGYGVVPFRVRACCVGADIRRERVFLLAELQEPQCAGLEGDVCEIMEGQICGGHDPDAAGPDRWSSSPRVCRRADGIPNRVDRLRSLGNAVCPRVAEFIGRKIIEADTANGTAP